ncbi:MAG: peptidoglycan bridge formation glycyltransferase FemA/FemB family protein [Spirochaetales bacterium]|nr:peptidoglycan bridge formation glycyltransferase FemA/FemB family protein [Spirochaetales bacterium]
MRKPYPHLLQTPEWGKAKVKALPFWKWYFFIKPQDGTEYTQYEIIDDLSKLESSVLILERKLGLGQRIHYIPRGPYVDWQNTKAVEDVLYFIKIFARKKSVLFTRFEPDIAKTLFDYDLVVERGFKPVRDHIQPQDTVCIPIQQSNQDLLSMFHKKHRYNIKLAEKRGLSVRTSTNPEDISVFYRLLQKTEQHHGGVLHIHPENYYRIIMGELAKNNMARLYIVEKEKQAISASLVVSYGNEAIYLFGASDYEFRRDMPNHLREWQSIQDARAAGRDFFDMWGATMRNDPTEGIKRYKLGFYPEIEQFAGTFDWSPQPLKYRTFTLLNKLRRKII